MRTKRRLILISLIGIGCLLGTAISVLSFEWNEWLGTPIHWENEQTTMWLHPDDFPQDPQAEGYPYTENLIKAMQDWNNVIGSDFVFNWAFGDGENDIYFINGGCEDYWAYTTTKTHTDSSHLDEADIWFDADCPFVPSSPNREADVTAPCCSFLDVAHHELGHALGLNHEFDSVAAMNYGWNYERLMGDDKDGVRFLYPGSGADTDLSVRNAADDAPGYPPSERYINPPSSTVVQPGDIIQIEYSVNNMGTGELFGQVGFYLGDRWVGTTLLWFPWHSGGTFEREIWIPAPGNYPPLIPGNYPLYAYMDDVDSIAESDEGNNKLPNPWGTIHLQAHDDAPNPPGKPVVTPPNPGSGPFTLSWAPSSCSACPIKWYLLYDSYTVTTGDTTTPYVLTYTVTGTSFNFSNLYPTSHTFWVYAIDKVFLASESSPSTEVVVVGQPPGPPGQPIASPPSPNNGTFTLSWVPSSNATYQIDYYLLYGSYTVTTGNTTTSYVLIYGVTGTSFDFSGLPVNTYTFWVKAVDDVGQQSDPSPSIDVVVDTIPPSAPATLTATAGINADIYLDWADNTEPDLSSYKVYRATTQGGPYNLLVPNVSTSTYTDSAVTVGVKYYYRVTAVDQANGESSYSNEASAVATNPPPSGGDTPINPPKVLKHIQLK